MFKDDDECIFYYGYNYDNSNQLKIIVQRTIECPTKVNVVGIVVGVVIGIVVIGLVVLIAWKFFTTIKDKRELAQLIRETKNPKWEIGANPVYIPATTTYKNPTYAGKR